MAITFPRSLPYEDFIRAKMELATVTTSSRLYGGKTQTQIRGPGQFWRLEAETDWLINAKQRVWQAWFNSLRGGVRTFVSHRPGFPYPRAYPNGFDGLTRDGGGAFDGTASATEITATSIEISNLPTSFSLLVGDLVGLVEDGVYGLFEVAEDATASSGVVTVSVEPGVSTSLFTTSAAVHLDRPKAEFILETFDFEETANPTPVSFVASQRIY